jgi:hypothetical protein
MFLSLPDLRQLHVTQTRTTTRNACGVVLLLHFRIRTRTHFADLVTSYFKQTIIFNPQKRSRTDLILLFLLLVNADIPVFAGVKLTEDQKMSAT